jgi:hypothetical protein
VACKKQDERERERVLREGGRNSRGERQREVLFLHPVFITLSQSLI